MVGSPSGVTKDNTTTGSLAPSNPSISGTDSFTASFTSPASNGDAAYVYKLQDVGTTNPGITELRSIFEVSFANISNGGLNSTNNEPLFLLMSSNGNGSPIGGDAAGIPNSSFATVNADVGGNVSFGFSLRNRFFDIGTAQTAVGYSLGDTYRLELTLTISGPSGSEVMAGTLDVFQNGVFQEQVSGVSGSVGFANFDNLEGYAIGVVDAGSNTQQVQGDFTFDNLRVEIVPEPSAFALVSLIGVVALMGRRSR